MDRCFLISCAVVAAALSTSGEVVAGSSKRPGKAFAADDETSPALNRVTEPGSFGGHEKGANLQTGDGGQPSRLTGEPPVQACQFSTSPEKLQVELNPYSLEAKFDCGLSIGTNTVEPDCKTAATNNCCDKAGEHCDTSISTAVGVKGSAVMDTNTKLVSVKLEDTPENPEGQLHFKCTKASNTCIVTVNMPAPLKGSKSSASCDRCMGCEKAGCLKLASSLHFVIFALATWMAVCAVPVGRLCCPGFQISAISIRLSSFLQLHHLKERQSSSAEAQ